MVPLCLLPVVVSSNDVGIWRSVVSVTLRIIFSFEFSISEGTGCWAALGPFARKLGLG